MRTRSHSKAFRNALLWTWWLPLFAAVVAGGVRYSFDKDQASEFIAVGKLVLTLPGGQAPDEATIKAHIRLLESASIAKQAETRTGDAHPELQVPRDTIAVTHGSGGLLSTIATGPDSKGTQTFLNKSMEAYITTVELMRRDPSPAADEFNRDAVPRILELAEAPVEKRKELLLPAVLTALAGAAAGLVFTLLVCSAWAFFCPANTQPSLDEIMKAVAGLDPMSQSVLAEWLRGQEPNS